MIEISESDYFVSNINVLEGFIQSNSLKRFNKVLKIEKWHPASIFLIYLSIIGVILTLITLFIPGLWIVFWFFTFFSIIMLGFVFAKPENKFNFPLVLLIFSILVFIPSAYGQSVLSILSLDTTEVSDKMPVLLNRLGNNPFSNLPNWVNTLQDVLNLILFIAFITISGSTIADAFKLDFGSAAKKAAMIAIAITVLTVIYAFFDLVGVENKTIWETMGDTWNSFLKGVGLAQLDQSGNVVSSPKIVINGFFQMYPLINTFLMLGIAVGLRKTDYNSVLFAKSITSEDSIMVRVKPAISLPIVALIFVMGIYVIGYFLVTADPEIVVNPAITLGFYLFALITLLLIGMKILIINKEKNVKGFVADLIKWTVFGLIGLWLWFQVFQPIAYQFNLTDQSTSLSTLSQTSFGGAFFEQLFLVAMPETLLFQAFAIGLGNRIYFYFARSRIINKEIDQLHLKSIAFRKRLEEIPIDENSTSRANLRNIAKAVLLEKKIVYIDQSIKERSFEKHPTSNFILPSLISALIGSFFFSWYHSFRRGISFVNWWQNPTLGLVYFGAGFFLCLICFFSYSAGILTHAFNNYIALLMFA